MKVKNIISAFAKNMYLVQKMIKLFFFVADDVVVAVSNSGLVKVWMIHDANDARLVWIKLFTPFCA